MARAGTAARPLQPAATVVIADGPDDEWLGLWWAVDGRGGKAELETGRAILAGCPSVYALARDDDGVPAAVGRLAMVAGTGGIYCMATSPSHRRQGYASAVLQALTAEGASRGLGSFWLLVTAANHAARQLYGQAGFTERGRYYYRQQRPSRA
jgi:ribosomal protein S18 acetylase RimI-like enzyme